MKLAVVVAAATLAGSVTPASFAVTLPAAAEAGSGVHVVANQIGKGRLRVDLRGVPVGVRPRVVVRGPGYYRATVTASTTLRGLRPGRYRIRPVRVTKPGGTVTISRSCKSVKVRAHRTRRVQVTYRWAATPKQVIPELRITNGNLGAVMIGRTVAWQLQATGGTAPYTFHKSPGGQAMPEWLSLSQSGRITGLVPERRPGVVRFNVYVRQADGRRSPYTGEGRAVTLAVNRPALPAGALARLPNFYDDLISWGWRSYYGNWADEDEVSYYRDAAGRLVMVTRMVTNPKEVLTVQALDPTTFRPIGAPKSIPLAGWRLWGGFYAAPDGHFYVLVGRDNPTQDNDRNVVAVRRYDSNWSLVGTAYIKGGASHSFPGIYEPFEASAGDMTLIGDRLVVHMGRLMYGIGGVHHQSNFTFEVHVPTMTATPFAEFDHTEGGYPFVYVSHSFAQFVAMNGDDLVFIDHGDAYPRSIQMGVMANYPQQRNVSEYDLLPFNGRGGDNFTGATVSGLISNSSGVVIVGNSIRHPNAPNGPLGSESEPPNAYTLWADPATGAHTLSWLSTIPKNAEAYVLEPRVVPLSANRYAVLFSVGDETYWGDIDSANWTTHYRLIDATGTVLASATFPDLRFPSVQDPVVINHKIYWADEHTYQYASEEPERHTYMYGLDVSNPLKPRQLAHP